ncbi:MAG TPA: peptide ABC transporter substrate-binding protein [Ktedonobacterales bacterium]|jgi:peptide/nickel transport system substrate-binding protein
MPKKGRLALASSLFLLIGILVAACGGDDNGAATGNQTYKYTQPTHRGGTILWSDWQFPDSTNPWFLTVQVDANIAAGLWAAPLTVTSQATYVPDQLTEVPTQANGDVSKDGKTVTMNLRHDLKWSDGQPITADDFVYWLQVDQDPATGAGNTTGYDQIASAQAKDKYTVVLHYKQPFAPYLAYLPYAAPQHAWGGIANSAMATNREVNLAPPVTSGPFLVSDFAAGQSVTMVPNKYYVSTTLHPSAIDKLVFKGYESKDSLIAGYQAGETDHAEDFTAADLKKINSLPGLRISPAISYEHLDFNLQNATLQDLNVRKGIEQAIDRCQIIQTIYSTECSKLSVDTILPQPSPYYDASIKALPFNLDQAKKDMQAAGWNCPGNTPCTKNGKDFPTLNLVTTSGNTVRQNVTQVVQQDLTALGVPVNLNGQYYAAGVLFGDFDSGGILATGQYDLALFAYNFPVEPDGSLYPSFHSSEIPNKQNPGGGNWEHVSNPQVDQALDQGRTTLDPNKRTQIYKDLQKTLVQQVYTIPMYLRPDITLTSSVIGNYYSNPTSAGNTWNVGDWYRKQ